MPYIRKDQRRKFEEAILAIARHHLEPGELNYLISRLAWEYVRMHGISYKHLNDAMGALDGAKLEFYRTVVMPFEIEKLKENGDIH